MAEITSLIFFLILAPVLFFVLYHIFVKRFDDLKEDVKEQAYDQDQLDIVYAGFWKRLLAVLIDAIIVNAGIFILFYIYIHIFPLYTMALEEFLMITVIMPFLVSWIYFAAMESSTKQATIGKMALRIIVTDLQGNRISFLTATGRHIAKFISGLILFIGFVMAGFTRRKQALHDILTDCLVVEK